MQYVKCTEMVNYPAFLGFVLLVLSVSQTIISQNLAKADHTFPFKLSALVLSTEVTKMAINIAWILCDYFWRKNGGKKTLLPQKRTVMVMAVPAFLYTVSNTLEYKTIAMIGSTNAQVWLNIRIVITAVLSRVIVARQMSVLQWISILLLLAGVVSFKNYSGEIKQYDITLQAVLCLVTQTTCSSLAGVYQEVLFKTNNDERVATKSLALYFWTCALSYSQWTRESVGTNSPFFEGFTALTWICLLVNTLYGQAVALTLFFCDNMVKVFATSLGPIAAVILDALYLWVGLELKQLLGAAVVTVSTIMFYSRPDWLLMQDFEALSLMRINCIGDTNELKNALQPNYTEI